MIEAREYHELENKAKVRFTVYIRDIPRVYAVSCNIVQTNGDFEEFTPSDGFGATLLEVGKRKSNKRLEEALEVLKEKTPQYLDWFRVKEGLMDVKEYEKIYEKDT